jgi:hypothetical protein
MTRHSETPNFAAIASSVMFLTSSRALALVESARWNVDRAFA